MSEPHANRTPPPPLQSQKSRHWLLLNSSAPPKMDVANCSTSSFILYGVSHLVLLGHRQFWFSSRAIFGDQGFSEFWFLRPRWLVSCCADGGGLEACSNWKY
ncbi:uncharacterized protein [Physcomitrium patens]|uniref:Uncharacterized protein n=1 Tax=Physcomitrium patens TaxID=3218 RepID=A0A2K1L3Y6_PHYPA|nr:hypothetical protein PHYPA_003525 [Physcomitrium patens]